MFCHRDLAKTAQKRAVRDSESRARVYERVRVFGPCRPAIESGTPGVGTGNNEWI